MTSRKYFILNVFATRPFHGNPLAVVLEAKGLDPDQMQMIANEFNSAVTAFVTGQSPENGVDFTVKLFTPDRAIAFASQPTIGVAILLAMLDGGAQQGPRTFRLHQDVGIVECTVDELRTESGRARFFFPQIPRPTDILMANEVCALALGLEPHEIGFGIHHPRRYISSVTYNLVPVSSPQSLARIKPHEEAFHSAFADSTARPYLYAYTRLHGATGDSYRARMFWPGPGARLAEDPASASGAVTLSAALVEFEGMPDGIHQIFVEQGYEMGRPSQIGIRLVVQDGSFQSAEITGEVILICEGELRQPSSPIHAMGH